MEYRGADFTDVSIHKWELSLKTPPLQCAGDRTIGPICPIPGAVYSWSPSAGLSDPNIAYPSANPSAQTTYTLTMTHPGVSCTLSALTATVIVDPTNGIPLGSEVIPNNTNVASLKTQLTTNSIPYTGGNSTPVIISSQLFYVAGLLTIDADVTFKDCDFIMADNSRIDVNNGAELRIEDTDNVLNEIRTCDPNKFWDGIFVDGVSNSNIQILGDANLSGENRYLKISNMRYGIKVTDLNDNYVVSTLSSAAYVKNTEFDRNMICLDLNNSGVSNSPAKRASFDIDACKFDCSAPLVSGGNSFYPTYSIKATNFRDYVGLSGIAGIQFNYDNNPLSQGIISGKAGGVYSYNSDIRIGQMTFTGFNNYTYTQPVSSEFAIKTVNLSNVPSSFPPPNGSYPWNIVHDVAFLGCKIAIGADGQAFYSIDDNTVNFDGINYFNWNENSVFVELRHTDITSWVTNNQVYNVKYGVFTEACTDLSISNNTMDMEVQSNDPTYSSKLNDNSIGILARNINNNIQSKTTIYNNTIKHAKIGIQAWFSSERIEGNTIEDMNDRFVQQSNCPPFFQCPPASPAYRIRVLNTADGYVVERNKVELTLANYTSSPNTDQKVIGISLENTANANNNESFVNCNSVQNTGIGLKFSGTNEAATEVKRNLMKANYYGFVLANSGYIGDVGSSGSGADNEWEGTFGFSNTYSDNSNGNNCTLYVQNSSPYNPSIATGHGTDPTKVIRKNTGNSASSAYCVTYRCLKGGSNSPTINTPKINTSRLFLKGKQSYMVNAGDSALRLSRQLLYWQLSRDTVLQKDTTWRSFADSVKNTAMGRALGKNTRSVSRTALDHFDTDILTVEDIEEKVNRGDTLSTIDSINLYRIAALCPYYDGIAVYFAREVLMQMGVMTGVNECEITPKATAKPFKRLKNVEADFNLYPNPTKGEVNLQYIVEADEVVNFELFDVLGKKQQTIQLREGNLHRINVSKLNTGIYFYRLSGTDGVRESGKLMIE